MAAKMILLRETNCEVHHWDGLRWNDIYIYIYTKFHEHWYRC
jgi:hypothetical protein